MADAPLIGVVDDDQSVRESLQGLLRSAGFRAEAFSSAEDFLASGVIPRTACLILDVRMPGVDGLQLRRHPVVTRHDLPIVLITAHGDETFRRECVADGVVDCLLKPFSEDALLGAVRTALDAGTEPMVFETLAARKEGAVLFADIAAPPMNLLGPQLVRDLVSLIRGAEADDAVRVLVFRSADSDYFISHVDVTRVKESRQEAAKLTGEPSLALLFRHLSASRLVTIAQIEGRVRGVGSEFVLACDMRFAARESAIFGQFEPAFGVIPGAGGAQHLARLMGRGRALEVMLSAGDYDADLAERYGWINRALPARDLSPFVRSLAHRIAGFPAAGHAMVKDRVNAVALPPIEDIRRDSDLFLEGLSKTESQSQIGAAMKRGFQTREGEMALARMLGDLISTERQDA